MAVFIDTGIFVAARNKSDRFHDSSVALIFRILDGVYGDAYTSDYVFDEAIAVSSARMKDHRTTRDVGEYILTFPVAHFLFTPREIFLDAWNIHERYQDKPLSLTDCSIIAWCRVLGIEHVATVDAHFDGVLSRAS